MAHKHDVKLKGANLVKEKSVYPQPDNLCATIAEFNHSSLEKGNMLVNN